MGDKIHVSNNNNRLGKNKKKKGAKEINLTLTSVICRSINNKKASIRELLNTQNVDVALCSELNHNWKPPKFKGFISFQK
jgi:hypothetical protein